MPPTDYRLDHENLKHPLEKHKILENIISQLLAWNQDENLVQNIYLIIFRRLVKIARN